jgi:hypothetical protein
MCRGHGTQIVEGRLVATVCGTVEKVNKLISVRPLRSRYGAEVGDVVIGRVTDVIAKRWKMDINGRQEAALMLSAVDLPGGVQVFEESQVPTPPSTHAHMGTQSVGNWARAPACNCRCNLPKLVHACHGRHRHPHLP